MKSISGGYDAGKTFSFYQILEVTDRSRTNYKNIHLGRVFTLNRGKEH